MSAEMAKVAMNAAVEQGLQRIQEAAEEEAKKPQGLDALPFKIKVGFGRMLLLPVKGPEKKGDVLLVQNESSGQKLYKLQVVDFTPYPKDHRLWDPMGDLLSPGCEVLIPHFQLNKVDFHPYTQGHAFLGNIPDVEAVLEPKEQEDGQA